MALLAASLMFPAAVHAADEIHWTIMGPTAVTFDWRGVDNTLRFGLTSAYDHEAVAHAPSPVPYSSAGPFREAPLTDLQPDTLYHYAIGGGGDHTFRTPRAPGTSDFTIYAEADIGSTENYARCGVVQGLIAQGHPTFALLVGDLTYGDNKGLESIDQHFNDMMIWSQDAAYMPAWGNHEWEPSDSLDDLRNYKGRFDLPNGHTSTGSPAISCCGKDWYWFDYGNVRFIAYPEPWPNALDEWFPVANALMDSAEADGNITFVVTFGHRPAYSSGHHPGMPELKADLDSLGATHSKYKLNITGHSHNYERTYPQHGVTHITTGGGGASLENDQGLDCFWLGGCPPPYWSAYRAFHHHTVRLTFSATAIKLEAICGPPGGDVLNPNDITCDLGAVFDSTTISVRPPHGVITSPPPGDITIVQGQDITWQGRGVERDADGDPLRYHWNFDGAAPNLNVQSPGPVMFNVPGMYRVSFTVVDSEGFRDPTPDIREVIVLAPDQVDRVSASISPNPVQTTATFTISLPRSTRLRCAVFDVRGRRVRTLADEPQAIAGTHRLAFDGRSAGGKRLPAGVYFYAVDTGAGSVTRRFTIVR